MEAPVRRTQRGKKTSPAGKRGRTKAQPHADLCVNCTHREGCTLSESDGSPVHFCEEFRCEGAGCVSNAPAVRADDEPARDFLETPGDLKGLCVNCEDRFDCRYPKPPGGVWHCQEYR